MPFIHDLFARYHSRDITRNRAIIDRFLGKGKRANEVEVVPLYCGELLAWAFLHYMAKKKWHISVSAYHERELVFFSTNIDYDRQETILIDGQVFIEKWHNRLVAMVDICKFFPRIIVEGLDKNHDLVRFFIDGVAEVIKTENFCMGEKIEFSGKLRFIKIDGCSRDNVILDQEIKKEIFANTLSFLSQTELWKGLGIPLKRGVLLAGEPGTGKTIICKALMSQAGGITCISTDAYSLVSEGYLASLCSLAEDLAPSIVFIEDIDLIGWNKAEFENRVMPSLISLLGLLDGLEEKEGIVTVAATNSLEALDDAFAKRPSRFDRVFHLTRLDLFQRCQIIDSIFQKIPLDTVFRQYIASRTEGFTHAKIQEVIFSVAIDLCTDLRAVERLW